MELVDPNVSGGGNNSDQKEDRRGDAAGGPPSGSSVNNREGWGTAEATEMITNNLFYITVKVRP